MSVSRICTECWGRRPTAQAVSSRPSGLFRLSDRLSTICGSLCPDAWLINFTNPSGMVTEAAIKKFGWKKTIGLCNVPTIAQMREPGNIGETEEELTYQFAGLNHFHWHKVTNRDGEDVTAEVLKHVNEKNGGTPVNIYQEPFPEELLDSMKMVPCGYHRYYFMQREMLEHSIQEFKKGGTRAEQMYQVEHELFELYAQPGLHEKPEQLGKRGGAYYSDAACECISAIYNDRHLRMTVSTENKGALPCLAPDSIVEVSSLISARGAEPIAWGRDAACGKRLAAADEGHGGVCHRGGYYGRLWSGAGGLYHESVDRKRKRGQAGVR